MITNLRLISQQLANSNCKTPKEVVAWMGAMQAQDYNMAKWAIGIRLPGSTDNIIEDAFNRGEILRTHVMRPTWHFVTPENYRWMMELTAPRLRSATQSNDRNRGLTNEIYNKCNRIIERALEGNKQLSREEIAVELKKHNIEIDNMQMYRIMFHAELDGIVCSGALHGRQQTYTLVEERIPPTPSLHREEALARLVRLYFTSHCPATLQDFTWWSGLSLTDAKIGLEAIKPDFISEKINGQIYWISNLHSNIAKAPASVLLLPAYDEYVISYKNREAVVASHHQPQVISSNGIFYPVVLKNGIVVGRWKKAATKKANPAIDFFNPEDQETKQMTDYAVAAFRQFMSI